MDQCGPAETAQPVWVEAHPLGRDLGEVGDPIGVAAGMGVEGLDGLDEPEHGCLMGHLQLALSRKAHVTHGEDDQHQGEDDGPTRT